jgi:hypothetical protein
LKSISIPQSIRALEEDWYVGSSLTSVIFESGASLLRMLEGPEADLDGLFDVYVFEWDAVLSFPGYPVSIIRDVDHYVQLVKND